MIPIRYIDAGPMPQRMSIDAATAPGRAAAQVGQAIEGLGETGQRIVQQVREVEDAGKTAEMFSEFNMSAGQFSNDLLKREDTGNWTGDWQTKVSEYKGQIEESDLSPRAKAAALNRLTGWGSERAVSFEKQALLKGVEMGKVRVGTELSYYEKTGQWDEYTEAVDRIPPEIASSADKDRMKQEAGFKRFEGDLLRDAKDDPEATLKRVEDPDFIEKNPEATIAGVERAKEEAMQQKRAQGFAMSDTFDDGVASGAINRPEQIEQLFPKASPALQEEMRQSLTKRLSDKEKAAMDSPAYQDQTIGNISARLDNYTPQATDDVEYFELKNSLKTVKDGTMKDRLTERLENMKKGALDDWKTESDVYRAQLKQAYQDGGFGNSTARQPLNEVIATGLLNDKAKLKEQGFSERQVEIIATGTAKADELEALGVPPKQAAALAEGKGAANQIALLRVLHDKRQDFVPEDADPYVRAAFDAIVSGKEGFVEFPSRSANREAETKYGKVLSDFEKRVRLAPEKAADIYREVTSPYEEAINRAQMFSMPGENEGTDQLLPPKE